MARVDEQEQVGHLHAPEDIRLYHFLEFGAVGFRTLGVAVAGEIDDIPGVVYEEMVDEHGLAGGGRGHGHAFFAHKHIDKRRLAHIRAADESIFVTVDDRSRYTAHVGRTYEETCGVDNHF